MRASQLSDRIKCYMEVGRTERASDLEGLVGEVYRSILSVENIVIERQGQGRSRHYRSGPANLIIFITGKILSHVNEHRL